MGVLLHDIAADSPGVYGVRNPDRGAIPPADKIRRQARARENPWTENLWVFDSRTNIRHNLKTKPLKRSDLDEFVECYNPKNRHQRKATWSEANTDGRWRCFTFEGLSKRNKLNLDNFWLKDTSLGDADSLPEPDVLAQEIAEDLKVAMELFAGIANELKE